jgi:prepilin peptidase CpaA
MAGDQLQLPADQVHPSSMASIVASSLLVGAVALAAGFDLRSRRIPNLLTAGGLITALVLRAFLGGGALGAGLLGAGIALAIVLPLFAMRGVGGGDAKLLIMVGAFLGPAGFIVALLATAVVGGVMSAVATVRAGVLVPVVLNTGGVLKWVFTFGRRGERTTLVSPGAVSVPYGVAIAIGSVVALYIGGGL